MPDLVQKVVAQSEPTFPYDGPFEQPEPPPATDTVTIELTSATPEFQVGTEIACDIQLKSKSEKVKNYSIFISFDPSILEVVDADANQTGVQVGFLDSFSTLQTNLVDNTAGTIVLSTQAAVTSQSINRRVAAITFTAKKTGTSIVDVHRSKSLVATESSGNTLSSTSSIDLTVTGQTQTNGAQLPESGLSSDVIVFGNVLVGTLMLYVGMRTVTRQRRQQIADI